MTEQLYYEDKRFVVTRSTFKTPEGEFSVKEIGSARRGKRKPARVFEIALIILGVIFSAIARSGVTSFWFAAVAAFAAAVTLFIVRRDVYLILLYMGSGEQSVVVGNRDRSIRICNAVNVAVVEGHPRQVSATQLPFDATLPDLAGAMGRQPAAAPSPPAQPA